MKTTHTTCTRKPLNGAETRDLRRVAEVLYDHTLGMTLDELHNFLLESIAPTLEKAWAERDASEKRAAQLQKERDEEHEARKKAEKEAASKDKENEALKKALEDERNKNKTNVRNTFGSKSRRSGMAVDGGINRPDRNKAKGEFDSSKPESSSDSVEAVDTTGEGDKVMSEAEVEAHNSRIGKTYTMADASTKVTYPCDRNAIPEGWIIADQKPIYKVMFDTETVVTARNIEFVKIKRRIEVIDEDGFISYKWQYRTMHFPYKGETLKTDTGIADLPSTNDAQPFEISNIPVAIPSTSSTPGMAAKMILDHFLCFTPINRIGIVFKEFGFKKCRQGLTDWMLTYAERFRPAYNILRDRTLKDNAVLFMDETWARLHLPAGDRKVYEWIVANKVEKCVFYFYDDGSRGRKVIEHLLEGRNIKAIHTDGYNAYFFLEGLGIIHIACTAHIWRYIMDWYNATQDPEAKQLLMEIASLYAMEAEIRGKSSEEILRRRQSDEVTQILTNYKARLDLLALKLDSLPGVGQTALSYALKLYPNMARWRDDADFEIDNNFAERSARPSAMSRKMQLHYGSHKGAEASCIIRSLIETCKLWKKSVFEYVRFYFNAIVNGRTDYENLMPWCMSSDC